jgi:hypothetical protein
MPNKLSYVSLQDVLDEFLLELKQSQATSVEQIAKLWSAFRSGGLAEVNAFLDKELRELALIYQQYVESLFEYSAAADDELNSRLKEALENFIHMLKLFMSVEGKADLAVKLSSFLQSLSTDKKTTINLDLASQLENFLRFIDEVASEIIKDTDFESLQDLVRTHEHKQILTSQAQKAGTLPQGAAAIPTPTAPPEKNSEIRGVLEKVIRLLQRKNMPVDFSRFGGVADTSTHSRFAQTYDNLLASAAMHSRAYINVINTMTAAQAIAEGRSYAPMPMPRVSLSFANNPNSTFAPPTPEMFVNFR